MKTPITKERLRQHWNYNWWKYALLAAMSFFAWNLIFAMTAYRPPAEKIVDLYIYGYALNEPLDAYMARVQKEQMSDMEQMTVQVLTPDETYGTMVLSTRLAAGEGDVYVMPKSIFQSYSGEGYFVQLDDQLDLIAQVEEAGVNLERCWRLDTETRTRHLYGFPVEGLPGLSPYVGSSEEMYVSIIANNGNDENVMKFLNIFIPDMLKAPEN